MKEVLLLLLLLSVCVGQTCGEILSNCDECDYSVDPPEMCLTCHGWYEQSWDTGLCVLSARLIILCVVSGLFLISVTICAVFKIQDYRAKYTERPTNIESLDSDAPPATEEQLASLRWTSSKEKINDVSRCNICDASGGSVRLPCGHVFHGDCICWHLGKSDKCPVCNSTNTRTCTVHCIKCLCSYLECPPQLYVDIKKAKSRVCDDCTRKE